MSSRRRARLKRALGSRDDQIVAELRRLDPELTPVDPAQRSAAAAHAKNLARLYEAVAKEVKQEGGDDRAVERLRDALAQYADGFRALARALRARNEAALDDAERAMDQRFRGAARKLNSAVSELGLER